MKKDTTRLGKNNENGCGRRSTQTRNTRTKSKKETGRELLSNKDSTNRCTRKYRKRKRRNLFVRHSEKMDRVTEIQVQEMVKKISDKIHSITIKKQYKYQMVRIKIKLQDRFEKSFTNGNFAVS
jgi:hypothetical protein